MKSENIKNLEDDVKKAFRVMLDEYGIQPTQKMVNLIIKRMVEESHYRNAEELIYSYEGIKYEIKMMMREALKSKFGG